MSAIPHEVLMKLPYDVRVPLNDSEDVELFMESLDAGGFGASKGLIYNGIRPNDCPYEYTENE